MSAVSADFHSRAGALHPTARRSHPWISGSVLAVHLRRSIVSLMYGVVGRAIFKDRVVRR